MLSMLLLLLAQAEPAPKRLPAGEATLRTKAIQTKLEEPAALVCPKKIALQEVLDYIRRATKKGANDTGIPIYIDLRGLLRAHQNVNSMVSLDQKELSLKDLLARVLASLGMTYLVKDDVLIISDRQGVERERTQVPVQACDDIPATKALMARLEEPVPMPFLAETPLRDILDHIESAIARPSDERDIAILVAPSGKLDEVGATLDSTVEMDLEGVPLKTTLRLLLEQLGRRPAPSRAAG